MTNITAPVEPSEGAAARSRESSLSVLIADSFQSEGADDLRAFGCQVELNPDLTTDQLPEAIAKLDPHVLVVRSTKVPAAVFEAAGRLCLVIRAGAGYDTIDVDTASARGVFVCNCPGMNSTAVAELVMGLILASDRHIPDQAADLRKHVWAKKVYSKVGRGLKGRTLGIVGLGQIGRLVARRALAFEMHVLYCDIIPCEELDKEENVRRVSMEEVLSESDFVTLHVPANESTKHLINAETLALMKKDAVLINSTRGSVLDEAAVVGALRGGQLAGAAMDVYADEPAAGDKEIFNELLDLPNFIGTHHVGASTEQAQSMIASEVVRIVETFAETGEALHCVNLAAASPATCQLTIRYQNKTGVLAHVFQVLSDARIATEEMQNIIFAGARAACVKIQLDDHPSGSQIDALKKNESILSLELTDIPH